MKKLTKVIGLMCMAALVAVSASSCKKTTDEGSEFEVGLAQLQGYNMSERAYIDINNGCQLTWNEGDQIMVYNLATDYTKSVARIFTAVPGSEGLTVTRFKGRPVGAKKDIGYRYFYPAYKASGELLEDNRETFYVSPDQEYNPDLLIDPTSLVMACTVNNMADDFVMEHIFGILNLEIVKISPARVRNIVITDNTFHLTGEMSLKLPVVNSATLDELMTECYESTPGYEEHLAAYLQDLGYEANGDGYSITLDCSKADDNQGIMIGEEMRHFFVTLRPGALYRGFTVTVNYMDESLTPTITNYQPYNRFCIRPGWFTTVPMVI